MSKKIGNSVWRSWISHNSSFTVLSSSYATVWSDAAAVTRQTNGVAPLRASTQEAAAAAAKATAERDRELVPRMHMRRLPVLTDLRCRRHPNGQRILLPLHSKFPTIVSRPLCFTHATKMSAQPGSPSSSQQALQPGQQRLSTIADGTKASSSDSAPASPASGFRTTATETVVHAFSPHLTTFSRPFARFGVFPVGGRSTAVQLQEPPNKGALWVLASTPLDGPTRDKVKEMGDDVKFIVAPDFVHHLYVKEWADAFPSAKCIGVEGLDEKRKDIKWAGLYGKDSAEASSSYGFENEIQARYFPTFANKDVVFLHKASRSLIVADLIFNLPGNEQYASTPKGKPTSPIPFLVSFAKYLQPYSGLHASFLWLAGSASGQGSAQDKRSQFAKDAAAVASWDFDRIIPCHGDVVDGKGREAWLSAFKKVSGHSWPS